MCREDGQAFRIGCLDRDQGSQAKFLRKELHQARHRRWWKVLDHLRAKRASKRTICQCFEIFEDVALLDIETLGPAQRDGFVILVDAASGEPGGFGSFEKLAAST